MNLLTRELKSHQKSLLIWGIAIAAFMFMSMAKYNVLASDAAASQQLMKALPATLQAIFGMTGLSLTTIDGYYGICFIFIAVMLAVQAGMLGAEIVAKEETGKTAEFLYVKPIGRARALTFKLLAGLILIAMVSLVTYLITCASLATISNVTIPFALLGTFTQALLIIQLVFFSIGVLSGAALGMPKKAAGITATVIFISYSAYVLWGLSPDFGWLQAVSPFAYFAAKDVIANNALSFEWVMLCVIISASAITASYIRYLRRDFEV